jgi:hypothetical protein
VRLPALGARRDHAERYLFLVVAAFALSVAATRVFLAATGYPKVGGGGLHIAHMLWGGLLLVVASILPLVRVGSSVLVISSIAGGIGVGLFIDEIGKFITENNDYFFAPAAPLIYGAVLLLVALWVAVARRRGDGADEVLQSAVEAARDGVDGRLSRERRDQVLGRLETIAASDLPEAGLAARHAELLASPETEVRLVRAGWLENGGPRRLVNRLLPARVERVLVYLALGFTALGALLAAGLLVALLGYGPLPPIPNDGPVEFPQDPAWIYATLLVATGVGIASAIAIGLMATGRTRRGVQVGAWATLVNLVAGGLLTFYVQQFEALGSTVLHLAILGLLLDMGWRLDNPSGKAEAERQG